jgi:hypothetical protein
VIALGTLWQKFETTKYAGDNLVFKLPKSLQSKAKRALQEIWIAETKKDALAAFDAFVERRRNA